MITQEFLALLLETLAATIPAGTHSGDAGREACLAMACTMLDALHPADAKEAAAAARAIAAHFAAMDGFARAARPASLTTRPSVCAATPLPPRASPIRSRGRGARRRCRRSKSNHGRPDTPRTWRCPHRRCAIGPSCRRQFPACPIRSRSQRGGPVCAARPLSRRSNRPFPCRGRRGVSGAVATGTELKSQLIPSAAAGRRLRPRSTTLNRKLPAPNRRPNPVFARNEITPGWRWACCGMRAAGSGRDRRPRPAVKGLPMPPPRIGKMTRAGCKPSLQRWGSGAWCGQSELGRKRNGSWRVTGKSISRDQSRGSNPLTRW